MSSLYVGFTSLYFCPKEDCIFLILDMASCQTCTRFLPAWAPVSGFMAKLMSFTTSNQTCQVCRSVSIQRCICSCPCSSMLRSSSGDPLALFILSVQLRAHSARTARVSSTDFCQVSTVWCQVARLGVPPSPRIVSNQFVSSNCWVSAHLLIRFAPGLL